jgi:peptide-methionine (R)-S-oxide reductase
LYERGPFFKNEEQTSPFKIGLPTDMGQFFISMTFFMLILNACTSGQTSVKPLAMSNQLSTDSNKVIKTEEEWKQILSPEEFRVLRQNGTEYAFTGKYDKFYEPGKYYCRACGNYLFSSDTKYNSGCGWPAFYDVQKDAVVYLQDNSYGMKRVEVRCARCDSHLGHVFEDGPRDKTGLRYCINSVCLRFEPIEK